MPRVLSIIAIVCSVITTTLAGSVDPVKVPLPNQGFEEVGGGGLPLHWTIEGNLPEAGNLARVDTTVHHGGVACLLVQHRAPGSFTLVSAPVHLVVGRLYRLSGWVKTDHVRSDADSRYPTSVAATLSMASFPFTNHSSTAGGTHEWTKVEVLFLATRANDNVRVHLGYNGTATGSAWFDDLGLEEVDDITQFIPMETVRWLGPAFRYTDKGWTFVHIEGEPYARGYQYGYLLAREMGAYMDKLAVRENPDNPKLGWAGLRTLADALMLRKYDPEFLEEMKGIADGGGKAGGTVNGKAIDLLDVVTMNSAVDLGQLGGALAKTVTHLSGRSFRLEEEEQNAPERLHKCSSFLANGPATSDGKIVFGQLFMWNGYTGVHWNVICDVVPAKGHRLVYETFPGGIHSGADFYINDAGVMIGETTVMQTPFDPNGTPQSSRIRKAAQYGSSIDDVVRILTQQNNGLYTNDWLIGDTKTNETAILLLGTKKWKLWRSGSGGFPGGTTGFYWSVNNAKYPEVRKEYIPDPGNAPFDLIFNNMNRDLAFVDFYRRQAGKIDVGSAARALGSSPINRPHACDGKITTSEMAERMVFLAHFGKVTTREKFPEKGSRLIADLPNAQPHLTLGYSVCSPIFVAEKLKALKKKEESRETTREDNFSAVRDAYAFGSRLLWSNTVYPASEADDWFISASAAYWNMMSSLPSEPRNAAPYLRDQLAEINCRLQYTVSREGSMIPLKAERRYDVYNNYQVPRIRGTYLLHQLRLFVGNERFSRIMNTVHTRFKDAPMKTSQFIASAEEVEGATLKPFIMQWLERDDSPSPDVTARVVQNGDSWNVDLKVTQKGIPYHFMTTVEVETAKEHRWQMVEIKETEQSMSIPVSGKPMRLVFNAGNDIPVNRKDDYILSNYFDDYHHSMIVYGTTQEIEANHTLALRYQTVLADAFTDLLAPVRKESEIEPAELGSSDLIILGGPSDNALTRAVGLGKVLVARVRHGIDGHDRFQLLDDDARQSLVDTHGDLAHRGGIEAGGRKQVERLPLGVVDVEGAHLHRQVLRNRLDDPLHAGTQVGRVGDDRPDVLDQAQPTMPARLAAGDNSLFGGFSHIYRGKAASLLGLYTRERRPTMRRGANPTNDEAAAPQAARGNAMLT